MVTDAEAMEHPVQRGGRKLRPPDVGRLESKDLRSSLSVSVH